MIRLLSGLTLCLATLAPAAAAGFQNGSFENFNAAAANVLCPSGINFCGQYNAGNTGITGWSIQGDSVDVVGPLGWIAADGNFSIDLNGIGAGSLAQTFDTVAGTRYRVEFWLGGNFYGGSVLKQGTATAAAASLSLTFDDAGSSGANMGWSSRMFEFTATDSSSTLSFSSTQTGDAGLALDKISVTAVPEPQAALLMLLGLAGLGAYGRRRAATATSSLR